MGEAKTKKKLLIEEISKGLELNPVEMTYLEGLIKIKRDSTKDQFREYISMFLTKIKIADVGEDFLDGIERIKEMV